MIIDPYSTYVNYFYIDVFFVCFVFSVACHSIVNKDDY